MDERYRIDDLDSLLSPSLVIFRPIVVENLRAMIRMAGRADALRPHVKTHKMPAVVRLAASMGIVKQKCATIAEAEMLARASCVDVLVSYPLVGPNVRRLARLAVEFPETTFRATVDHPEAALALSAAFEGTGVTLPVLIDLDVGMGRTGITPGEGAKRLYGLLGHLPNVRPDGLHAYDGHQRQFDLGERRIAGGSGRAEVFALRDELIASGFDVPRVVLGGTPSFPVHAEAGGQTVEFSPGTSVFHDGSYGSKFPDLPFTPAALLLTRVVSRPGAGRLCLDLGHKAVAADPSGDRVTLLGLPGATLGPQSEEHLVVETPDADRFPPGTTLLAIPTHVCPTCALHQWAYVVEDGKLVDTWEVGARDRVLTI